MRYNEKIKFLVSAVVFGATWGVLEAFLGSYLHMLKVPFKGALMSGFACVLLSAGRFFAPYRMVTISSSLIACLIKLVSVGAFKLGAMAGILIEGLIAEFVFSFLGLNTVSVFVSSFLVCFEGIPHFFFSSWLIYGGSIFDTYLKVIKKTAFALGLDENAYIIVLFIWVGVHAVVAAIFGWLSAISVRKLKNEIQ